MEFDRLFAHSCLHGVDLYVFVAHRGCRIFHCLQTVETCPLLGASRTAATLGPLDLHAQDTLFLAFGSHLHLFSLRLEFQEF